MNRKKIKPLFKKIKEVLTNKLFWKVFFTILPILESIAALIIAIISLAR